MTNSHQAGKIHNLYQIELCIAVYTAFSVAGPKNWNRLPDFLRETQTLNSFKNGLKTFLFREAFLW